MASLRIGEALREAQQRLAARSDSARLDAEWLLGHVLDLTRAQLFTREQQCLSEAEWHRFEALVQRRARGEPVAYLTGEQGFWTLRLKVGPAVLVPRPETELLVERALAVLQGRAAPRIADLGTGSGAIALALAAERPDATVVATDADADALAQALANAQALGLTRVQFRHGHWYEPLRGERYDLLVSNPPYIARHDPHLAALSHEPLVALSDGADGLRCLREIVAGAAEHLEPGGHLLVEHGYDQGEAVPALLAAAGFADIRMWRDFGGQPRVTGGSMAQPRD